MVFGLGSSKGKKDKKVPPQVSENPMMAYVFRLSPETWGGEDISGRLDHTFEDIYDLDDLEAQVAEWAGGNEFRANLRDQNDKTVYLGTYTFKVAARPKAQGKAIARGTEKPSADPEVEETRRRIEREKAEAELDKVRMRRKKDADELLPAVDEDDEEEEVQLVDPRVDAIEQKFNTLVESLTTQKLDDEVRQRERERREEERERHQEILEAMKAARGGSGQQSDLSTIMTSQMSAIQTIITASQESSKGILATMDTNRRESSEQMATMLRTMQEKSDNMLQLLVTRSDNQMEKQVQLSREMSEQKSSMMKEGFDLLREGWAVGLNMGMGKNPSEEPESLTGIISSSSKQILELVGKLMEQRGQGKAASKEEITSLIQKATQNAVHKTAQVFRTKGLPRPKPSKAKALEPSASVPVQPSANAAGPARRQVLSTEDEARAKDGMNKLIRVCMEDARTGKLDPDRLIQTGAQNLPLEVAMELSESVKDPDKFVEIVRRYGDPDLVEEMFDTAREQEGVRLSDLEQNIERELGGEESTESEQVEPKTESVEPPTSPAPPEPETDAPTVPPAVRSPKKKAGRASQKKDSKTKR